MKLNKIHGALFAIVYLLAGGTPSIAANWLEYYHNRSTDTRFYYDSASIKRSGPYTLVRQYDSKAINGVLLSLREASIASIVRSNRFVSTTTILKAGHTSGALT